MKLSRLLSEKMALHFLLTGSAIAFSSTSTVIAAEIGSSASAVIQTRQVQPDITEAGRRKDVSVHGANEPRVELERLESKPKKRGKRGKGGDAFGAKSWYVPPPPPVVKPLPPPPPTAPPVPFTFLGTYEQSAKQIIMLVKGGQVYTVSVGDIIENTYRIDKMEQGAVDITYLPLDIKQTINTGN